MTAGTSLKTCAKAYAAAATAAVAGLLAYAVDGLTVLDVVATVLTATAAGAVVYATPNTDPTGTHQDESVQPPTDQPAPDPQQPAQPE